jgi:predicted DNA-binding transcriptional regulator AlpA
MAKRPHELPAPERRVLNVREAADYCGLPIAAFRRAIREGTFPRSVYREKKFRWDRVALDRALDVLSGIETPGMSIEDRFAAWEKINGRL